MRYVSFPQFPNSRDEPFGMTSPHTPSYNCIAWAFGDNSKWFWPDPENTYYWPENISREVTIESFIQLFNSIGYIVCNGQELELEYEKIAVFTDENGEPTHAARQLENGFWTSKLGRHIDVQHTINSIEEGDYGMVELFMKRLKAR